MSAVRALPVHVIKTLRIFAVVFALLMVWAVMPAPARAASTLTEVQIQAVVGLLKAFDVDSETIGSVDAILRNSGEGKTEDSPATVSTNTAAAAGASTNTNKSPERPKQPGMPACVTFVRTLIQGSQGEDVMRLQELLQKSGDYNEASTTGFFGPKTEAALRIWQKRMGIASSTDPSALGSFGPLTRSKIVSECIKIERKPDRMPTSTHPTPSTSPWKKSPETRAITPVSVSRAVSLMGGGVAYLFENSGIDFAAMGEGVLVLNENINNQMSDMGNGAAAVWEGYVSLFEL